MSGGGSGGGGTTTTVNKTEIPPEIAAYQNWQNNQFKDLYNKGLGIFSSESAAGAPQQTTAPLSYDENAGISAVRAQQGKSIPYLNQATNLANKSTSTFGSTFNPTDVTNSSFVDNADKYMSPYVKGALDSTAAELDRRHAQDIAGIKANAAGSGAFGGDREALLEAESNRNNEANIGNLYATGLQNAYTQAGNQFNTEQALGTQTALANQQLGLSAFNANRDQSNTEANRSLDASKVMSGIAALQPQLAYNDANALLQAGGLERANSQATYDTAYQNAINNGNYPWQQLQRLQGALTPQNFQVPITQTGSSTAPGTSAAAGALGGGLAGSSLGFTFGGPVGAGIGGLAGLALGAFM